jgi:DNA-binding CsgD family transcriptional regulator
MNDTPTPVIPSLPTVRRVPAPPLGRRRPEVLVRLEAEWQTLAERPSTRRRVASWGLGPTVRTLDDALAATGWREFRRPSAGGPAVVVPSAIVLGAHDRTSGDGAARCLLVAARADDLAARVLLQRMLPGLSTAARRWRRRADDGWAPIDELVATAWSVIRTFPFETRPSHLVANLLRDTEYQAYRKKRRRLLEVVPSGVPEEWDWPGASRVMAADPAEETLDDDALLELARMAARVEAMRDDVLDDADRVVLRLLAAGLSLAEAAEQLGCTSRTVQNHRLRLVHRLRAALVA